MMQQEHRYSKVVLWWKDKIGETELTLYNKTLTEARENAEFFGYKKPCWYLPWQYLTGGLGVMTVDYYPK